MKTSRALAVLILLLLSVSLALLLDHLTQCDHDDTDCLICKTLSSLMVPAVVALLVFSIELLFVLKADGDIWLSHYPLGHSCRAPPASSLYRA